jgi:hypothetical protein
MLALEVADTTRFVGASVGNAIDLKYAALSIRGAENIAAINNETTDITRTRRM